MVQCTSSTTNRTSASRGIGPDDPPPSVPALRPLPPPGDVAGAVGGGPGDGDGAGAGRTVDGPPVPGRNTGGRRGPGRGPACGLLGTGLASVHTVPPSARGDRGRLVTGARHPAVHFSPVGPGSAECAAGVIFGHRKASCSPACGPVGMAFGQREAVPKIQAPGPRSAHTVPASGGRTRPRARPRSTGTRGGTVASVEVSLKEMMAGTEGAVAAAVVDYTSGMALGTLGGGKDLDPTVAAAGNTDVIRAKVRTMEQLGLKSNIEDILITLENQYDLIR